MIYIQIIIIILIILLLAHQLMDKSLDDTAIGRSVFRVLFRMGKVCSQSKNRPEMVEVLRELLMWK